MGSVVHLDQRTARRKHSRFYYLAICGRRTTDFTTLHRLPAPLEDFNQATCIDCLRQALAAEQIAEQRARHRADAVRARLAHVVEQQRKREAVA